MRKDTEEAIARVLAGLRDTDAPAGMEDRILDALEGRAASRPGWRRFRPEWLTGPVRPGATKSLAWGVALAGVVAVVLAVPAIRRAGHPSVPSKMVSASVEALAPADSAEGAKSVASVPANRSGVGSMRAAVARGRVQARSVEVASGDDALAWEEMHAASRLAPPMPLTEQERLLLRVAHKGDPVEFAELNPVERAAQDAEEKAEVQRFFVPGKAGDNE